MIVKFQCAIIGGNTVLVYDKKMRVYQELPMTDELKELFAGRYKMYRRCRLSRKGVLHIGREVNASF